MDLEVATHFITALLVLFPVTYAYLSLKLTKKRSVFAKNLFYLSLGILPLATYHLFEGVDALGIGVGPLLPPEGTLAHTLIDHLTTGIAFFAIGLFCRWVHMTYIAPIHKAKKVFE